MKLTAILVLGLAACTHNTTSGGDVARGKQLVDMGGCADCHTPKAFDPTLGMPVPDRTRYLSGHPEGAPEKFAFAADSDALIVKGLIAVLGILFSGRTPEEIAKIDVDQAFRTLGLDQHISPSRRNGLVSMVEKIKSYAKAA